MHGQNVIAINNGDRIKAYLNPGKFTGPVRNTDHKSTIQQMSLPTEVKHGGMVWTTINPNPTMSVDEWTAGAFDCIARSN